MAAKNTLDDIRISEAYVSTRLSILFFKTILLVIIFVTVTTAEAQNFTDLVGVNYMPNKNVIQKLGIKWIRLDLSWSQVEKKQGTYDWSQFDSELKLARAYGLQVLPILAYTPNWDQKIFGKKSSPPKFPDRWKRFVDAAIARYTAAPFNLKYFQVWNEPTKKAGFWLGTDQEYIDDIYIPAAKIIRQHGGKVVFGGWPISNTINELDQALSYHEAWKYTDIVDFHYFNGAPYEHIYDKWIKSGKCDGIWQTEFGYTDESDVIYKTYVYVMSWALQHEWTPNKYKLFWFPIWKNGPLSSRALIEPDVKDSSKLTLTRNGQELGLMNELFGAGALQTFNGAHIKGTLDDGVLRGFRVGSSSIVFSLIVDKRKNLAARNYSLSVPLTINPMDVEYIASDGSRNKLSYQMKNGLMNIQNISLKTDASCPKCKSEVGFVAIRLSR